MPTFRFSFLATFSIAVAATLAACTTASNGGAPDASAGDDSGDVVTCQNDPRVDTYTANMTKASASGAVKVTLVVSDPGPPTRGNDSWTIKVTDGAGMPLTGATIGVLPFMPDHGHGTSAQAVITQQPDSSYSVTPLYLFMPGVWRVTFSVSVSDAAMPEQVSFYFCIAG